MKKIFTLLSFLSVYALNAQVSLPYTETFTYADGNLVNQGNWTYLGTPNTSAPDEIKVTSGVANFDGIGNDLQSKFTVVNSGSVFYKFKLTVSSNTAQTDPNGGYFAGFVETGNTFGGTIWTKRNSDTSYKIGIEVRTATGVSTSWTTTDYTVGQTYTVIVAYDFVAQAGNDTVRLWVDNTNLNSPTLTHSHTGTDLAYVSSFFLRQDSTTETPFLYIDDLMITTSNNDVFLSVRDITKSNNLLIKNSIVDNTLMLQAKAKADVKLYNAEGKLVKSATVTPSSSNVDLSSLNKGVYILTAEVNGETYSQKIIKK
ncbi:MAG: T9SS type A sorting domain-containing protein [Cloacibacterium sp.]|uniref:T9SS type A sorting domain-containing protein n=1 Tax=Cloacibacterium sp. TaxID=1913682 RepID=UPI003C7610FD